MDYILTPDAIKLYRQEYGGGRALEVIANLEAEVGVGDDYSEPPIEEPDR